MELVSDREVDVFRRSLGLSARYGLKDVRRALYEVKLGAWRRISDPLQTTGGFPVLNEPVLAWFPGGKGEPARVALVERFDGWVPAPLLWQPVVMPLAGVSGAVRQKGVESTIVLPPGD